MTKDPVCGMQVNPQNAEFKSVYKGKVYYFCSAVCKGLFDREPQRYIDTASAHKHQG
jgi:YHS domain-containing protein